MKIRVSTLFGLWGLMVVANAVAIELKKQAEAKK